MRRFTLIALGLFSITACGSLPTVQHADSVPSTSSDTSSPSSSDGTATLLIEALDIGQGDATLIVAPSGEAMLVDTGPPDSGRETLLPELKNLGIDHLSFIILSHYDADHTGGTVEVLSGEDGTPFTSDDKWPTDGLYDIGEDDPPDTKTYAAYAQLTDGKRKTMEVGTTLHLGNEIEIYCLIANGDIDMDGVAQAVFPEKPLEPNDRSIGLLITYGTFRYWTGGDLPAGGEDNAGDGHLDMEGVIAPLIAASGPIDVLHLHHHGSAGSSSDAFLEALEPRAAVISAGKNNHYHHPTQAVLERLAAHHIPSYATETSDDAPYPGLHIEHDSIFIEAKQNGNFSVDGEEYTK